MDFSTYISKLKRLYEENDQELILNRGATEMEIQNLEKALGFKIGEDLGAAWLLANGGESWKVVFARTNFLTGYDFLSINDALEQRDALERRASQYKDYSQPKTRDRRIKEGWFQPGWLPFASFSGATLLLMADYSPAAGKEGQIIAFTHDPDSIDFVCQDFATLLKRSFKQISAEPDEYLFE